MAAPESRGGLHEERIDGLRGERAEDLRPVVEAEEIK